MDKSYYQALTTLAFLIGLAGNIAALCILSRTAKRRNKKHLFMLRCLASNDLLAQIGMLVTLNAIKFAKPNYWSCAGLVLIRGFGIGSGCVAFVMALERWLALTRPFLYHQLVTYQMLKRFLIGLWLTAVSVTYLPLFGIGVFYNADKGECMRFRYAIELKDKVYAYIFFAFGAILCLCIVLCNSCVIWELSRIRSQHKILVRRISRSIISNRLNCIRYQTPEEVAFAKLMAVICIIFIACWVPQVISVPVAQFSSAPKPTPFEKVAEALLCIYFTLDPFVYVLQNYIEGRLTCCSFRKSTSSLPTTTNSTTIGTPTSVLLQSPSFNTLPINEK